MTFTAVTSFLWEAAPELSVIFPLGPVIVCGTPCLLNRPLDLSIAK